MATLAAEHKPSTLMYCPQAADFAKALGTAARHDNGHIVSLASSLALALRSGRSTLAVAGVFGAGKTRSLTFLLAWLALTTHLKIAVVHKENPAGRAVTKLLTAFELEPDHQRYFIRPVRGEEAEANTACTIYDLRAGEAAPYIPGCRVVIVTKGLVWDQKGQTHSTLNTHVENVDLLVSEEAQQDMDLKSAFESGILEAKAFHSTTRVRHACLDAGFTTISPQGWRYCHSLRIVKLPDTVVTLGYAVFQGCYSLQVAEMPGCVEFGVRVFSECCALESG